MIVEFMGGPNDGLAVDTEDDGLGGWWCPALGRLPLPPELELLVQGRPGRSVYRLVEACPDRGVYAWVGRSMVPPPPAPVGRRA